jgi:methylated-DNA-[protein]-cysteine S-methyltransferase
MTTTHFSFLESPLGKMLLTASAQALTGVHFVGEKYYPGVGEDWRESAKHEPLARAHQQLKEYFAARRTRFDLALAPEGTPFQRKVWRALTSVPFGETRSYGEIAANIGAPKASRAVGAANGRNPISIIVPCHRIIGASGDLTGYAGGLQRKQALLALESARGAQLPLLAESIYL